MQENDWRPVTPQLPAAGWMPDPSRIDIERYWDGSRWTERTRDSRTLVEHRVSTYDPLPWATEARTRGRGRRRASAVLKTLLALAVIAGIAAFAYGEGLPPGAVTPLAGPDVAVRNVPKPAAPAVTYPVFGSDELVNFLSASMVAQTETIDVTFWAQNGYSEAMIEDSMYEALAQNPYLFAKGWSWTTSAVGMLIEPTYSYGAAEAERRRVATSAAVAEAVKRSGALEEVSPAAKVTALHDYITTIATYDTAAFEEINASAGTADSPRALESQEAYGILVDGTAVCNGYAQAFDLMANAVGLYAVIVTGSDSAGVTGGSHAWNRVYVSGEWKTVDTTWDDNDAAKPGSDYLMLDHIRPDPGHAHHRQGLVGGPEHRGVRRLDPGVRALGRGVNRLDLVGRVGGWHAHERARNVAPSKHPHVPAVIRRLVPVTHDDQHRMDRHARASRTAQHPGGALALELRVAEVGLALAVHPDHLVRDPHP